MGNWQNREREILKKYFRKNIVLRNLPSLFEIEICKEKLNRTTKSYR